MTTDTLAAFDAVTTPLDGELVIEASAGTGKTWSLTRIVLRLVVEKGMPYSACDIYQSRDGRIGGAHEGTSDGGVERGTW